MIGTTGTETRFLNETDLPDHARLNAGPMSPKDSEQEDKLLAEAIHKSQAEHQGNIVRWKLTFKKSALFKILWYFPLLQGYSHHRPNVIRPDFGCDERVKYY